MAPVRAPAPATQRTSEGFEAFREGLDLLRTVVADPDNIAVGPEAFYLNSYGYEGFVHDLVSDYRVLSVVRTKPGAAFFISRPAHGTYYPAFIMYDEQGVADQVVSLFVGNERKGVAVAAAHDNRSYLFVLSQPCEFTGTALITLMTPDSAAGADSGGGSYRIENLLLLKEKPRQEPRRYGFSSVLAVPSERAGRRQARITWITDWATRSRLEYGPSTRYGSRVESEEELFPPSAATYAQVYVPPVTAIYNNHRLILDGLQEDRTYHFRLLGTTPDGTEVASPDHTFSTAPHSRVRGTVEHGSVPLEVANEAPVERASWPVTSGIPFPQGALTAAENTRLLNRAGAEVPLQAAVLAEWPDGSVKWLLLDFQADVGAAGSAEYRLEYGNGVVRREGGPRTPIEVAADGPRVELSTGPLKLLLDCEAPCFPGRVWIDANGDGVFSADEEITNPRSPGSMELVTAAGTTYGTHHGPCSAVVEERGPLRTVVKVQGRLQAADGSRMFTYITRINAYAGKDFLRVLHTWENDRVAENFTAVRSLVLRTPLRLNDSSCTLFGADDAAYRSNRQPTLAQLEDDEYTVAEQGGIRQRGQRAQGTVDLSDAARGLTVAMRDFWQNYPKSLGAAENSLEVGLCPPLPDDRYGGRGEVEDKLYYYLQGGEYKFKQGVSRTHELVYRFHAAGAPNSPPHLQEPLRARAPAAWYCDSKAFGDVAAADARKFPEYEQYADNCLANYLETRETGREYGVLNFGDWYHVQKWGNIEYDTPHVFFLHYARGGDPRFFAAGEQAVRHYLDVDTCHHHADHGFVDRVYAHCIGHVGDYYPYYYRKGGAQGVVEVEVDHTWVQGLLDYHLLSGDRRALEIATRVADKYDQLYTVNFDFCNCRRPGWHLILTMAMYQATGDHFYLNAAKLIIQRVRERYTPDGWPHQLLLGHCECLPRCSGNADFMVGVLLSGLKRYHQATGDEAAADLIVGACEFLIREHWLAAEKAFRYTRCPKSGTSAARNSLILEGPAYAYRLSGDERFKSAVLTGFYEGLKGAAHAAQPIGKHFGERAWVAPHILYDIDTCMR